MHSIEYKFDSEFRLFLEFYWALQLNQGYQSFGYVYYNYFYLSFVDNFNGYFFFVGDEVSFFHVGVSSLPDFFSEFIPVAP